MSNREGFTLGYNQGLVFQGIVSSVPGANQFIIMSLANPGWNGKFANSYYAYVAKKGDGTTTAPYNERQLVTAYNNTTGQFTTNAFSAAVAVNDEILIVHPSLFYAEDVAFDAVFYDSVLGTAGTTYLQGTAEHPVNNLADVITIAAARNLRTIYVRGSLTIAQDVSGYRFIGMGNGPVTTRMARIIVNAGAVLSGCEFTNLAITINISIGAGLNFECHYCEINGGVGAVDCTIRNSLVVSISPGNSLVIYDSFIIQIAGTWSGGGTAALYNCSGWTIVSNMINAGNLILCYGGTITLAINATDTAGTINIYGKGPVVKNAGGGTVITYTNTDLPVADAANNNVVADVIGNKSDAAVTAVGVVASIIAYIKGILNQVATTVSGRAQPAATTIDLNQAAATYTLFTGTAQVVDVEKLVIQMPNAAAGGALTSISIVTDDATPQVLIDTGLGAVANLTAENQLTWSGFCRVAVGKRIRLIIAGGAHGVAYVCSVNVSYRAAVSGGYLA